VPALLHKRGDPCTLFLSVAIGGAWVGAAACVPAGNSTPSDAAAARPATAATSTIKQAPNVLRTVFEDNFDRATPAAPTTSATPTPSASASSSAEVAPPSPPLGPNWYQAQTNVWHIEKGRLCGEGAHNHGVWLRKPIPVNARIEFDAIADSADGDLKAEVWGDGQSAATSISYTNATSYLAIFGGWHNTEHVLARINEHGGDRKEIKVDKNSDDPRERPVTGGQIYHFKIERNDGKTVRWYIDGVQYLSFPDKFPLVGIGHDHFGFNDWEVKVCFDNVKVTPLPL
jgi:hypothetical protein